MQRALVPAERYAHRRRIGAPLADFLACPHLPPNPLDLGLSLEFARTSRRHVIVAALCLAACHDMARIFDLLCPERPAPPMSRLTRNHLTQKTSSYPILRGA